MIRLKDVYFLLKIDIQAVFLSCLVFSTAYSLKLTAQNSRDGSGTFIKCETMKFECLIQPYTNTLSWRYYTKEIAACSFDNCQYGSDLEGAVFTFDTVNGIFHITMDKLKDEYNRKGFECFDGTNKRNVTATFDENGWKSYNFAILITVIIVFNIVVVIFIILFRWKTPPSTLRKAIKLFWLPLVIFVVGVLLTFVLILVTRFSEDSVVEEYDNICGWGILLICFGIYVLIAICLFVALIVKVLHR